MRKKRAMSSGAAERRSHIIKAALACFNEKSFANTTMEEIRIRSGASNGSIYHHFKSKDQLAAAVYLEGIAHYQEGMIDELKKHPPARDGIYSIVRYHLGWVMAHTEWSRYLFQMRHAGFMAGAEELIRSENIKFAGEFWRYFSRHINEGTLRALPVEVFIALILGPCQELARYYLNRPAETDTGAAVEEIAGAAWQALRVKN